MKCPSCSLPMLESKSLDDDLSVLECKNCGGYWLQSYYYWLWKEHYNDFSTKKQSPTTLEVLDSQETKTCPECSKMLRRYTVGRETGISIDRCETCRGIWFDKNEWELLKNRNLHDTIHLIFSSHWQKNVEQELIDHRRDEKLAEEIGETEYKLVRDFKTWISKHPERMKIISYLNYTLRR